MLADKIDIVRFIEDLAIDEKGELIKLEDHQKRILRHVTEFNENGKLPYTTIVYSCPKKSGKTAIAAVFQTWWAFTVQPPDEIINAANDFDQSVGRVFKAAKGFIKRNPILRNEAVSIGRKEIELQNGTIIKAIPSDYTGEAGANQGLAVFDELWGYLLERSRRLYEELTPVPTRKNSIRFVCTYAGWEGESELLEELYHQIFDNHGNVKPGVERPFGNDLPCYTTGDLFVYWDHEPRMPWQTPEYYESQRRQLRPNTYLRLHENRWTSNESGLFDMEVWDSCVDPDYKPPLSNKRLSLYCGVDASTKKDRSAVVTVYKEGNQIVLGPKRFWQPSKQVPMDLEETMEAYILWLHENFHLCRVRYDPYQFHRSATTLAKKGVRMEEFPQTTGNLVEISQNLFDLVQYGNLKLYFDDSLRKEAVSAIGKETPRGIRICKEKASQKIDQIVALAMAAHIAVKTPEMKLEDFRVIWAGERSGPDALMLTWCQKNGWNPSGFLTPLEWLATHPDKRDVWNDFLKNQDKKEKGNKVDLQIAW